MQKESFYVQKQGCHKPSCPIQSWSEWSSCSKKCGLGEKYRYHPDLGSQSSTCFVQSCSDESDGYDNESDENFKIYKKFYSNWTKWSVCSSTCGSGTKIRHRVCFNMNKCREYQNRYLNGRSSTSEISVCQLKPCQNEIICPIDAKKVDTCINSQYTYNQGMFCGNQIGSNQNSGSNCYQCICLDNRRVFDKSKNECVLKENCNCFNQNDNTFIPPGTVIISPYDKCNVCKCVEQGILRCTTKKCDQQDTDADRDRNNKKKANWCQWSDWQSLNIAYLPSQSQQVTRTTARICQRIRKCNCPSPSNTLNGGLGHCGSDASKEIGKIEYDKADKYWFQKQIQACHTWDPTPTDMPGINDDKDKPRSEWSEWSGCDCTKSCESRYRPSTNQQESRYCQPCKDRHNNRFCPNGMSLMSGCNLPCDKEMCCDICQQNCSYRCVCPPGKKISRDGTKCVSESNSCGCVNWSDDKFTTLERDTSLQFNDCLRCSCSNGKDRDQNDNTLLICRDNCDDDNNGDKSRTYTQWSNWSPCENNCIDQYQPNSRNRKSNTRSRTRKCRTLSNCDYTKLYQVQACPEPTEYCTDTTTTSISNWSAWSVCSVTCGNGIQIRNRYCLTPNRPTICLKYQMKQIRQCSSQEKICREQWSNWSAWSMCSSTCRNIEGLQYRRRVCAGDSCQKNTSVDYKPCFVGDAYPFCRDKDGNANEDSTNNPDKDTNENTMTWTSWSSWSSCSRSCNFGRSTRIRECRKKNRKENLTNRITCVGQSKQIKICNTQPCRNDNSCDVGKVSNNCTNFCMPRYCDDLLPDKGISNSNECQNDQNRRDSCYPSCTCPRGYLESADGNCVRINNCDCQISTNGQNYQSILAGQTWRLGCNQCTCKNGKIICSPTAACDQEVLNNGKKNCKYTEWTAWSNCNITSCNSPHGRRFKFRSLLTPKCPAYKKRPIIQEMACEYKLSLPNCKDLNDISCNIEGEIRVGQANPNNWNYGGSSVLGNKCEHCVCTSKKRWKCMNICEDTDTGASDRDPGQQDDQLDPSGNGFSLWSNWSTCSESCSSPFKLSQKYRHRVCQKKICSGKYYKDYIEMDVKPCDLPLCRSEGNESGENDDDSSSDQDDEFNSSCNLLTQYKNFTVINKEQSVKCSSMNVKINSCLGGCLSKTVISNKEPYIEQICNCCTYKLDPKNPVKFLRYNCDNGQSRQGMVPNVVGCHCKGCSYVESMNGRLGGRSADRRP